MGKWLLCFDQFQEEIKFPNGKTKIQWQIKKSKFDN